jgi:hypothetical protein
MRDCSIRDSRSPLRRTGAPARYARLSAAICICLCYGIVAPAQSPGGGEISERFVDLNNLTIVFTQSLPVKVPAPGAADPQQQLSITLYYTYKGKNPAHSKIYGITFDSAAKKFRYIYDVNRSLTAVIDGERLSLGRMRLYSTGKTRTHARETLLMEIPRKTFDKFTGAASIRIELGADKFEIADDHLRVFRRLADHLAARVNEKKP